jgi:hypothetical protein
VEVFRNSRYVFICFIILLLPFIKGCASVVERHRGVIPQHSVEPVITSETRKYVRVVCKPPVMCCVSYETIENNNKTDIGICVGM